MSTDILSKDYITLLKEDIPNGRDDLINTSKTLEDVAQHCLNSYDKSLEQTVNYTAQALGSVAYKINLLATNFLEVLDQQNVKLNGLQTKVNHLNMQVQIHQEKTARLSIGKYTLPRDPSAMRPSKTIEPIPELNGKYRRREIDFTILDNVGHGVKDPQLGGSTVAYSNTSRRSSTSGTSNPPDSVSSAYAYSQSNSGGTVGPKVGQEYIAKYGKVQTVGRSSGLTLAATQGNIYRSPGTLPTRSQIPMASPNLGGANMMSPPPPPPSNYGNAMQYQTAPQGTRRSSSTSSANSSTISGQQKQYQTPNIASPQKVTMMQSGGNAMPAYGYPGGGHPMAMIPPPLPPNMPTNQSQEQSSASMIRYSELPPPPMDQSVPVYQTNIANLPPPPPSNADQFNANSSNNEQVSGDQTANRFSTSESIPIAHLQPNPYDSLRYKTPNDPQWVPNQYLCKVVTLYEYQQNKEDELTFQEHEVIYVLKKNNDGWWEGVMSNRTGLFPGNYVQVIN